MFKHAQRICVFTLAATGLFAQTVPTQETKTTGAVGIAYGQTARFNVLNKGTTATAVGVVCSALLTYYDGKGALLKQSTVTVLPGQIGSLDLFSDADLALPAVQRKQIRATFSVPLIVPAPTLTGTQAGGTTSTPSPACPLIGTLEIFDALSGKTEVVLGATHLVPVIAVTPATGQ
jgi:hypothetical protein